jgi:Uma2 family endonuclease
MSTSTLPKLAITMESYALIKSDMKSVISKHTAIPEGQYIMPDGKKAEVLFVGTLKIVPPSYCPGFKYRTDRPVLNFSGKEAYANLEGYPDWATYFDAQVEGFKSGERQKYVYTVYLFEGI